MNTVCDLNKCTGCMLCRDICPKDAIEFKDSLEFCNSAINDSLCINCNACHNVCPQNNSVEKRQIKKWKQGWAEESIRKKSSSGGFASAIMRAFIEKGGFVCSCRFVSGEFRYMLTNDICETERFIGSKYVRSNPIGAYKDVKNRLKNGSKVLFIGLPCHVAAMKNFVGEKNSSGLYTIDLICHGTPSPNLLKMFLKEWGYSLDRLKSIQFRQKNHFDVYTEHKNIVGAGIRDRYTMGFLAGLFYTQNCYECKYADLDRISDLTIGDSWGTELSQSERKKGISLALCYTEKGEELLDMTELHLQDVSLDKAIAKNGQLRSPSAMPDKRKVFFQQLRKNNSFSKAVYIAYPKSCLKQQVKKMLISLGFFRGGVNNNHLYVIRIEE